MKLSELIQKLQELQEDAENNDLDIDPEVRIMYQPNYPLQGTVDNVRYLVTEDEKSSSPDPIVTVAIAVESAPWNESPYGNREAWTQGDDLAYCLGVHRREMASRENEGEVQE